MQPIHAPFVVENLELRRLLSVDAPPLGNPPHPPVEVAYRQPPAESVTRVTVNWTDINTTESGYRLEWTPWTATAPNPDWSNASHSDWPENSVFATRDLDAGQKEYYRVRALEGSTQSEPSEVVTPTMPQDSVLLVSATIDLATPKVTVHWVPDPTATEHTIYRKSRTDSTWPTQPLATLLPSVTSFTDTDVAVGSAYEYRVSSLALSESYPGQGYVYAGLKAPLIDDRGTVLLVVDETMAAPLSVELSRIKLDLIADGWKVQRSPAGPNITSVRFVRPFDAWQARSCSPT